MRVFSFFSVESRLVLLLFLPHSLKPIRAIARVVWTQEPDLAEACDCGLQFIEVAPEDREAIAQYIEQGITA